MLKAMLFLGATAGLVYVSRQSLRAARSHGFYRFLAWEAIAALVLLNLDCWFCDPFAPAQLISWALLLLSLVLVTDGLIRLRRNGRPDGGRKDEQLLPLERTTVLVTQGSYRYIRHPLYASLQFLAWGAWFKVPSWQGGLLAIAATVFLVLTARAEEAEDVRYFGAPYEEYRKQTRMFIPFLF